ASGPGRTTGILSGSSAAKMEELAVIRNRKNVSRTGFSLLLLLLHEMLCWKLVVSYSPMDSSLRWTDEFKPGTILHRRHSCESRNPYFSSSCTASNRLPPSCMA